MDYSHTDIHRDSQQRPLSEFGVSFVRGGTYDIDLRVVYASHDRSRNESTQNAAVVHFP